MCLYLVLGLETTSCKLNREHFYSCLWANAFQVTITLSSASRLIVLAEFCRWVATISLSKHSSSHSVRCFLFSFSSSLFIQPRNRWDSEAKVFIDIQKYTRALESDNLLFRRTTERTTQFITYFSLSCSAQGMTWFVMPWHSCLGTPSSRLTAHALILRKRPDIA